MKRYAGAVVVLLTLYGCAPPPPPPPPPKPVVVGPPTDTLRIPLNDLGTGTYFGHRGGLYPNGLNQVPADHDSAAHAHRNLVRPLDVNGDEHPFGKYVLLSIGGSSTSQEWCSAGSGPPCSQWSLMGRAAADPTVNRVSLVIVNGAADSTDAASWMSATSPSYERIKVGRLNPLGLSENQVQAVWLHVQNAHPAGSLPSDSADAYTFLANLGQIARTLKVRYPYLQLVFITSAIYGGYAADSIPAEPYAYEEGFSAKWLIEAQVLEMRGTPADSRTGSIKYVPRSGPLLLWGPYLWSSGATARSDAFSWERTDFEADGIHPSQAGEAKVAAILLDFFKNSPYTRCWFMANQYCL